MQAESKNLFIVLALFISMFNAFSANCQKLYKTTWKQSGVIIGGASTMLGGGLLIENQRESFISEDINLLNKNMIPGIDRGTINNFSIEARQYSDRFRDGAWIVPFSIFFSTQGRENTKEIFMMYAEVISLNAGITQLTKRVFGRYRPFAYNPNVELEMKLETDTRRSFFSGHVSHVSGLSFFTAAVFDDLYPDSNFKYLVWAGAITMPAITGYLRVQAGKHFPTDVIAGYAIGT